MLAASRLAAASHARRLGRRLLLTGCGCLSLPAQCWTSRSWPHLRAVAQGHAPRRQRLVLHNAAVCLSTTAVTLTAARRSGSSSGSVLLCVALCRRSQHDSAVTAVVALPVQTYMM